MEKVLIISYFFPSCNLTAANRVRSWAQYFHESGIYPVIVTREWKDHDPTEFGRLQPCGTKMRHVKNEEYEAYYMPYKPNLRDRIFLRSQNYRLLGLVSKVLTFIQIFLEKLFIRAIPYNNIYDQAKKILEEDSIDCLIISANPFEQFHLGYKLKKKFRDIKYIADFRDDWNTNPLLHENQNSLPKKLIHWYNKHFEKRWLSLSDMMTAAAQSYGERLNEFHGKPFEVVVNGYKNELDEIKKSHTQPLDKNTFVMSYSGLIYNNQDFSLIVEALEHHARSKPHINFRLVFIGGLAYRTSNSILRYKNEALSNLSVEYTEFLDWEVNAGKLMASDALLMTPYGQLKGVLPSKTFEYMGTGKPIILYPSDGSIIEELLLNSGLGLIPKTSEELIDQIENLINAKSQHLTLPSPGKEEFINQFSRRKQASKMANIIRELCAE